MYYLLLFCNTENSFWINASSLFWCKHKWPNGMYLVAAFHKKFLHWRLTLYNKKIGKARSPTKKVLKLQAWVQAWNWIITYALQFHAVSPSTHPCDENVVTTVSLKSIYWNLKSKISEWSFFEIKNFLLRHKRNLNVKVIYTIYYYF